MSQSDDFISYFTAVFYGLSQWCKFLSQEVHETRAFFVAPPRNFPLSVCANFKSLLRIIHHCVLGDTYFVDLKMRFVP